MMLKFVNNQIFKISLFFFTLTIISCENNKSIKIESPKKKVIKKDDFEKITGNFVIFLRPNDNKFDSLKSEEGIFEVDSDFGFAIQNTIDSLNSKSELQKIRNNIITKRYIEIENCKNCPQIIDRDSILYGIILTSPNKEVKVISGVQALNYLPLIKEYFK